MKKRVSILLCGFLISMLFCLTAFGAEEGVFRWSLIDEISGSLEISNNAVATATAFSKCDEADSMTITASLQQYKNGKWNEIKQWVKSKDSISVSTGGDWAVSRGYQYQLVITSKVYIDNRLAETGSKTISYGYFN